MKGSNKLIGLILLGIALFLLLKSKKVTTKIFGPTMSELEPIGTEQYSWTSPGINWVQVGVGNNETGYRWRKISI